MKKLLCLLLIVLLLLSFAGCDGEEEYVYEYSTPAATQPPSTSTTGSNYDKAIKLMFKTYTGDFTEEDLKNMFPEECWSYYEAAQGKTVSEIYTDFSGRMLEQWSATKEEYGADATVKYEMLDRTEYVGETYEAFKAEMGEKYGIPYESFGICYEVKVKKGCVGSLKEEVITTYYHVIQINDKWYVSEVLTEMPLVVE